MNRIYTDSSHEFYVEKIQHKIEQPTLPGIPEPVQFPKDLYGQWQHCIYCENYPANWWVVAPYYNFPDEGNITLCMRQKNQDLKQL